MSRRKLRLYAVHHHAPGKPPAFGYTQDTLNKADTMKLDGIGARTDDEPVITKAFSTNQQRNLTAAGAGTTLAGAGILGGAHGAAEASRYRAVEHLASGRLPEAAKVGLGGMRASGAMRRFGAGAVGAGAALTAAGVLGGRKKKRVTVPKRDDSFDEPEGAAMRDPFGVERSDLHKAGPGPVMEYGAESAEKLSGMRPLRNERRLAGKAKRSHVRNGGKHNRRNVSEGFMP